MTDLGKEGPPSPSRLSASRTRICTQHPVKNARNATNAVGSGRLPVATMTIVGRRIVIAPWCAGPANHNGPRKDLPFANAGGKGCTSAVMTSAVVIGLSPRLSCPHQGAQRFRFVLGILSPLLSQADTITRLALITKFWHSS